MNVHTFYNFAKNNYIMRKSTKIIFVFFVLVTIPALVLGGSIISGIKPTDTGFQFDFDAKGIAALVLTAISLVLGTILYGRFLSSLPLHKTLFFSTLPLTIIYGGILFLIADLSNIESDLARSVQTLLNLSPDNAYNTILWAILVTLIFIAIFFFNYAIICRPFNKMEKVISRLGDGKVREERLSLGGGKQFQNIEHGLNKINNNYKAKDNTLKSINMQSQKFIPKQFFKFLGKNNITELELGNQVKKRAAIMQIRLSNISSSSSQTLEENFDLLNSFLNVISPLVRKFSGFIDKFLGNGLIAVFPSSDAALDCSKAIVRAVNIKNRSSRHIAVEPRISLHYGEVIFGIIGDEERKMPTIVSNEAQLLSQIDEIAGYMSAMMIFTKSVIDSLPLSYKLLYRYLGSLNYSDNEILLFENLDVLPRNIAEKLMKNKGIFERAVMLYNSGEYEKANQLFAESLQQYSSDKASYIYFNKSKEKLSN